MDNQLVPGLTYERTANGWKRRAENGATYYYYDSDLHPDRLDLLEKRIEELHASRNDGLATLNKGIDDLRQRIESRFAKMAEEHALDVAATDARMDRLSGILNEHEGRLAKMAEEQAADVKQAHNRMDNMCSHISRVDDSARKALSLKPFILAINERLDATDTWRNQTAARLDKHAERLRNIQDRVCELENYTGLDVRSAQRKSILDQLNKPRVQPTIKGGWLNVYGTRWNETPRVGSFCATKDEADRAAAGDDHRIACIRIPDFTEGEGL